jgi:hypothetical protein
VSSSGLIYAVIVGAWAAYLVPMWLRRQDELNEARPTERFSTAIRLLSGRAGMERRYAKGLQERNSDDEDDHDDHVVPAEPEPGAGEPDAVTGTVDVRAFAVPTTAPLATAKADPGEPAGSRSGPASGPASGSGGGSDSGPGHERRPAEGAAQRPGVRLGPSAAERARRSKALARRRRTTMMLFLAFTLGAIVAAVGGLAFLWAPAVPAVLLSAYIAHLRVQERRRFAFTMDRRRAEAAAQRVRQRGPRTRRRPGLPVEGEGADSGRMEPEPAQGRDRQPGRSRDRRPDPGPAAQAAPASPHSAGRRALVEQTDHAEWVDQQRERERGGREGESWDPMPVPLPTYVTAPVAPRATGSVDLDAPDTWSSARSSTVEPPAAPAGDTPADPASPERPGARTGRRTPGRRARERGRTPLFDQYAHPSRGSGTAGPSATAPERGTDLDRPRAANE